MDDKTKKLLDQVRKLLAVANDPNTTEAMAANYAAKAQEMLERHNLSLLDVNEEDKKQGIGRFTWAPKYAGDKWRKLVAINAARVYMTKLILTEMQIEIRGGKVAWRPGYILVGREANCEVARSMIDYLFATVVRLSKNYSSDQKERHLFEAGAGLRLSQRLKEMYEASSQGRKADGPTNLPALYSQELTLVDEWATENLDLKSVKVGAPNLDHLHSANGASAANSISLTGQIGEEKRDVSIPLPPGVLQVGGADYGKLVRWLEEKFGKDEPIVPVPGAKWVGDLNGHDGSAWDVTDSVELQKFIDEQPAG